MESGTCWNCLALRKTGASFCTSCGAPVDDDSLARASVDYLLREVGRWTWLSVDVRADVLKQYHERRHRLITPDQTAPISPLASPPSTEERVAATDWLVFTPPVADASAPPVASASPSAAAEASQPVADAFARPSASSWAPPPQSAARGAIEAAQAFAEQRNIRWFHALGALLLVAAGIGYLRSNWDTIGSIVVTLGLLVLPVVSFAGSFRLRTTLPDSSRGLAILGGVTLPAGLLALQLFGFVHVVYAIWAFGVFVLTAGVLAGVALSLGEIACVYLSAVATVLAAAQLPSLHPGTFGYPLLVFAFIATSWAKRPSNEDKLAIHTSSISQMMARVAIVATFGNGIAPDVNHVLVGVIGSMFFLYGAVISPDASALSHATASCAMTWLLVYLHNVAGHPTAEGLVERVLAPLSAVLAVTAQQLSVRFGRPTALPVARIALLAGAVVTAVALVAGPHDAAAGGAPLLLMVAVEMAAISLLFRGWPLMGYDARQTLFTMAALFVPIGVARVVAGGILLSEGAEMSLRLDHVIAVAWGFVVETVVMLAAAQAVDRVRGRAFSRFFAQMALTVGVVALAVVGNLAVTGSMVNATWCLVVMVVSATVFAPLFCGWLLTSAGLPMEAISEVSTAAEGSAPTPVDVTPAQAGFSMSRLLSRLAALGAPLAAAGVTLVAGVNEGRLPPSSPFATAAAVALALVGLALVLRDDAQRDTHWGEAVRLGSLVGAFWPALAALLGYAWLPGLNPASFTMGAAAVVFGVHAAGLGQPGVAHFAYILVHALLLFNVPPPIALEWYTVPLGLWIAVWNRRPESRRIDYDLVALLVVGLPSLIASFEVGFGSHLYWTVGVSASALVVGLRNRLRGLLIFSAGLLTGAAGVVSYHCADGSIVFFAASLLTAIIEPAFRLPRVAGAAQADAGGTDSPEALGGGATASAPGRPITDGGVTGQESQFLAHVSALLAPIAVAIRVHLFARALAPHEGEGVAGAAALGGVMAAAVMLVASRFAPESEERDVHWGSAFEHASIVSAIWCGVMPGLGVFVPGFNVGIVALLGAAGLLAFHSTRPNRLWLAHVAFAYLFGAYTENLPHPIQLELVTFPLAGWFFFSAWRLYRQNLQAQLEAAAALVLGGPSLLASLGPNGAVHAVAAGVAGVLLFTLGSLYDRAGLTLIGAVIASLDALYRIHALLVSMPWQAYATVAGLFLIGMGVLIERRRTWLMAYGNTVRAQWTYREGVLSAPAIPSESPPSRSEP